MIRCLLMVAALLAAVTAAEATDVPAYQPRQPVVGVIRISGHAQLEGLLRRWETGFLRFHPHAQLEHSLSGSDVAMAGLYTSRADIALLGRDSNAPELKAFEWIFRYQPERVELANGSFDRPGQSPPLVAYVHRDNPLTEISLRQLDALLSHERRLGAQRAIATWGDLGLAASWQRRPIHAYIDDTEGGTGRFMRARILGDTRHLNWDRITEFKDSGGLNRPKHDEGVQALAALSADPAGIAITGRPGTSPKGVKELALIEQTESLRATRNNLIERRYPLARTLNAYVNRKPGAPLDSRVREFIRYALSREGQQDIIDDNEWLPLSARMAVQQAEGIH